MKRKRYFVTLLLALVLCFNFSVCAFADETAAETQATLTAVEKISLTVTNSDGDISFSSNEPDKYTVSIGGGSYDVGEKAEFKVAVDAKELYFFSGIKKGDISLNGDTKKVSIKDVNCSNARVSFDVKISSVSGQLDSPDEAWWDGDWGFAEWSEVDGATGYKISINNNSVSVGNTTRADLRAYLKSGKDNTFKVRATSSKSGVENSEWTESDELYVEKYYDSGYYGNYYSSGSCSSNYSSGWNGSLVPSYGYGPNYNTRGWIQKSDGTWYYLDDNNSIHRGWLELSDGVYYLDSNGVMVTGWQKISGKWYVFDGSGRQRRNTAISSANGLWTYYLGSDGVMQTNCWQRDGSGRWYHVGNDSVDTNKEIDDNGHRFRVGNDGFLVYGWYYDGSSWYYYDYGTGYKRTDTIIDGRYWLDKNGRWCN